MTRPLLAACAFAVAVLTPTQIDVTFGHHLIPAAPGCQATPEGQVLVASNNVYEADKADARKTGDMRRFVGRIKKLVPFAPDLVMVQEVRSRGVKSIKRFLKKKFDCRFTIAVNAGATPWKWTKKYTHLLGRDTAVIVNTDSMAVRRTGYIITGYKHSAAAPGVSVKSKKTAWARVREKGPSGNGNSLLRVAAASVHFPRGSDFKSPASSERIKKRWSKRIALKLDKVLPDPGAGDAKMHVIAGDFNSHRYSGSPSNEMPPYHLLTHAPYNFTDGIIEHATGGNPNPIDFLFSTGRSLQAEADSNTHDENAPGFYSNHDLRWSLLGP